MFDHLTMIISQTITSTNRKKSFRFVIFLHLYDNIKIVTFIVFEILVPNFVNSTIEIFDLPEKKRKRHKQKCFTFVLLRFIPRTLFKSLIINSLQHQSVSLHGQMVKWSNVF